MQASKWSKMVEKLSSLLSNNDTLVQTVLLSTRYIINNVNKWMKIMVQQYKTFAFQFTLLHQNKCVQKLLFLNAF